MDAQDLLIGAAAYLILTLVGLGAIYLTVLHRDTFAFQQGLFLTAISVRFALAIALHEPGLYRMVVGAGDASGWEGGRAFKEAVEQSELGPLAIPQQIASVFQDHNRGYGALLGLYFFFTRLDTQLSAAAFSCLGGAMTALMAYRLARVLFSEWVAVRVGWLVCLFPSMIIWSIQTIKEPFVILCEVVALYACGALRKHGFSLLHIFIGVFAILVVLPLRFYAAYVLAGTFLVALLAPNLGRGSVPFGSAVTGALVLFAVFSVASDTVRTHQEIFETYDVEKVQGFRDAVVTGEGSGSGVRSTFDMRSNSGLILAALEGALHLLLAPFPWQFGGSSTRFLFTLPEMVVWWALVARGLMKGLIRCLRRQPGDVLAMLLFMFVLGLIYSVMFGNIGLIYRQRAQLLPYLFMIIMVGFEASRARRLELSPEEAHIDVIGPLARASSALETAS